MDHAATVRRLYELINAGEIGAFSELLADDFVEHEQTPGLEPTKEGVKSFFRMQLAAFPDLRMSAEDVFASGDKAVARVRYTGTNKGDFMGMPASGKKVDVQLIDLFLFGADGLVHEHWGVIDALAMMQQLGAVPQGSPGLGSSAWSFATTPRQVRLFARPKSRPHTPPTGRRREQSSSHQRGVPTRSLRPSRRAKGETGRPTGQEPKKGSHGVPNRAEQRRLPAASSRPRKWRRWPTPEETDPAR